MGLNETHLEYLKSVNVKNSNAEFDVWFLDGFIYGLDETNGKHETDMFMSVRPQ